MWMCLRHNRSHLTKMRWSQKEILFSSCVQKTKSINSMNFLRLSVALQCAGTLVSIVSLCFLLAVYLSYKELRNLLGKCLISLSWALLCYQIIFLCSEKSKEVELCASWSPFVFISLFSLLIHGWVSWRLTLQTHLNSKPVRKSSDFKYKFLVLTLDNRIRHFLIEWNNKNITTFVIFVYFSLLHSTWHKKASGFPSSSCDFVRCVGLHWNISFWRRFVN